MIKRLIALCVIVCSISTQIPVFASTSSSDNDYTKKELASTDEVGTMGTESKEIYSIENPTIDEHNTYIADLGEIYEIRSTDVMHYYSSVSGMESYDVYASSDGINFMYIGNAEETKKLDFDVNTVSYDMPQYMYARYVKFVMNKADDRDGIHINGIKVYGVNGILETKIDGEAQYSYYTQNPYRTGDDIRLQDMECKKLMDDDHKTTISTTEKWATIVVDLKQPYQIGNVDIYSLASKYSYMEGCEIRYSLDGKKFFTYTYYLNDNEKNGEICKNSFSGMPGRNARFLKIIMQTSAGRMDVSEIDINGYPIQGISRDTLTQVPLRVEMKNYLLAYLDWSTFNSENVSKVALYIEKTLFNNTKYLQPVAVYNKDDDAFIYKYATKTNLEPETTYYFAMTPFDADGNEYTDVKPLKVVTQKVIGEKVSDVFNITNHPNYGGAATKKFGTYTETMKAEAVRLMDEMGASNKNRLWEVKASDFQMYTDVGISTMLQSVSALNSKKYGNYLYSNGNESDLKKYDVNAFLQSMKNAYRNLKADDRRNVLCDPVLGGTEPGSLQWFDDLYKAGNGVETKLNFDVVDVHFYCKTIDEQLPGLPIGAPEILYKKIDNVREVMERYGDGEKPIISTETGFHTAPINGFQPKCDYETHRDYVVRMYMIMISQGIKEVWYYNFQDDGHDNDMYEHHWGLIDYFGVPKPAYYGYYNMYQQMRNAEFVGAVSGLSNPYYGYEFYDQMKNKKISVIWAADGQSKTMMFETVSDKDEKIEVIGSDGSFQVVNTENGNGRVEIGSGPVYIYSEEGIKPSSINVAFSADRTMVDTIAGKNVMFTVSRELLGQGLSGVVSVEGLPSGWSYEGTVEFDENQDKIQVVVNVPQTANETKENFVIKISASDTTFSELNVSVDVKPSIQITIFPEPVEVGKWDDWRLVAACTNVVDVPVSGKLSALEFTGVNIETLDAQEIAMLQPGQTINLYFNVDKPTLENGAVGTFMLDVNGKQKTFDRSLNFSACVNDGIKPTIDGVMSQGEWDNCHVITQNERRTSKWAGMSDLSFKLYRKWDEDNFYMAVDVADDIFNQPYLGSDIWQGDCVQFALDPARKDGVGISTTDYFELGLARNDKNELMTWAWLADLVVKKERNISSYVGATSRTDDGHTIYEISIPWGFLKESAQVKEYDCIGFSIAVNDNDGSGRKSYVMYMQGITDKKDPNGFEDMVLIKKK